MKTNNTDSSKGGRLGASEKHSGVSKAINKQADTPGVLTEAGLNKILKDMYDNMPKYEQPPFSWIKSSDIKRLKTYWWNPFSVFRYLKIRHQVIKIAVDITNSLPKASAYPTLSQTQVTDLVATDKETK